MSMCAQRGMRQGRFAKARVLLLRLLLATRRWHVLLCRLYLSAGLVHLSAGERSCGGTGSLCAHRHRGSALERHAVRRRTVSAAGGAQQRSTKVRRRLRRARGIAAGEDSCAEIESMSPRSSLTDVGCSAWGAATTILQTRRHRIGTAACPTTASFGAACWSQVLLRCCRCCGRVERATE